MRFYIRQKVFTLKDKFDITDEQQNLKYQVKGHFMSISNKMELLDTSGATLLRSNRKVLTIMPKYFIFDKQNQEVATIKRLLALRPRFDLLVMNRELAVEGSFFAHSFGIYEKGLEVASIKKKIISWGDTYEIEIHDEANIELFLFVVIILDQIIHEKKNR